MKSSSSGKFTTKSSDVRLQYVGFLAQSGDNSGGHFVFVFAFYLMLIIALICKICKYFGAVIVEVVAKAKLFFIFADLFSPFILLFMLKNWGNIVSFACLRLSPIYKIH